jgi:hypothetical protein
VVFRRFFNLVKQYAICSRLEKRSGWTLFAQVVDPATIMPNDPASNVA